jgi:hypothetical protein
MHRGKIETAYGVLTMITKLTKGTKKTVFSSTDSTPLAAPRFARWLK